MPQRTLYIFVKTPKPGHVKTRLGRDIGMTAAAWWFRHQSRDLIRRLARDSRWTTRLAVAPDVEGMTTRALPAGPDRTPQGEGDLGARMARVLTNAPPGPALIIGADVPGIQPQDIADAFAALGRSDLVFGPAMDGGYWLIGARRRPLPPTLFQGVRWSSEHALADTIASAPGASVETIRALRDVDTVKDLNLI